MPITVKHGEQNLDVFAALAVLAGMGQQRVPELPTSPPAPSAGSGGGGLGRGRGGKKRRRIAAGFTPLTREEELELEMNTRLREQRFGMPAQLEEMRGEALIKAQQFDYEYTTKQRQELARLNNARQEIAKSPNYTEDEKKAAFRAIDLTQAGVQPSAMPRDPNKPRWPGPEGTGPGQIWRDEETGALVTGLMGRNGAEVRLLIRSDQTIEYIQQKTEAEAIAKQAAARQKYEDDLWSFRVKEKKSDTLKGTKEESDRFLTAEEIQDRMDARFGREEVLQPGPDGAAMQEPQLGPQQEGVDDWWSQLESDGIQVSDGEKQLPSQIGAASALYRAYREKYGSYQNIPDDMKPAYREAMKLLNDHFGE